MKKKIADNQTACEYADGVLRDSRLLPISLLRCYSELDLNEKELVRLLRLIAFCYNGGTASLAQAAAEFAVDEDEALALLRPFLDRRLLEFDADTACYSCDGLRRELYLLWATRLRGDGERDTDLAGLTPQSEREEMRALSHLYRRFEQELGRPLRYSESDRLRSWVEDEQTPPELIEEALKRAALRDKCSMSYIGSILKDWQKKHFTTLAMVLEKDVPEEKEPAAAKPEKPAKKKSIYDKVKIN